VVFLLLPILFLPREGALAPRFDLASEAFLLPTFDLMGGSSGGGALREGIKLSTSESELSSEEESGGS